MSGKLMKQIADVYVDEVDRQRAAERLTQTIDETEDISKLASLVRLDWANVYFGAVPYLDAMRTLHSINDNYGLDSGKSIVLYFLANANTWRGPTAAHIKKRLKKLAGVK